MTTERDPLDLSRDEREARDADRRRRQEAEQERTDFAWLMQDARGRRIVRRLLDSVGIPTGDPFSTNAMTMAFNVGKQEVGKWLLARVQAVGLDYVHLMEREALK